MASWFCLAFAAVLWAHCNILAHGRGDKAEKAATKYKKVAKKYMKAARNYRKYKKAHDAYYDNITGLLVNSQKEILEMLAVMKLRLWKWQREDRNSFDKYHNAVCDGAEFDYVYNQHIKGIESRLTTRFKQTFYQAAAQYFKVNPYIFKRIVVGLGKGASIEVREPSTISHIIEATEADYDFMQAELEYDPYSRTNKLSIVTKYYSVELPTDDELRLHKNRREKVPLLTKADPLYHKIFAETLDQTQAAVLDFKMNFIKYSLASLLVGQSDVYKVADIFPSMINIQNTTRIYNPNMKKCLGVSREDLETGVSREYLEIKMNDCDDENIDYDWYIVKARLTEEGEDDFFLKHIRSGTCLAVTNPTGLILENCGKKYLSLVWRIDGNNNNNLYSFLGKVISGNGDTPTSHFFYPTSGSQTWSVSAPYSNGAVLTASYYENSPPQELIRNFPKILKAYMFKQLHYSVNSAKDTTEFFRGVKDLSYFAELPYPMQSICKLVDDGKLGGKAILSVLHDRRWNSRQHYPSSGYMADYKQMRKSLVWDNEEAKRFTQPNLVSFTNHLHGMYLRAGMNMISIINADSRYVEGAIYGTKEFDPSRCSIGTSFQTSSTISERLDMYTLLKEPPEGDNLVNILDNSRSIVKGLSALNDAALTDSALLKKDVPLLELMGKLIGVSRLSLEDGTDWTKEPPVDTIPMTLVCNTTELSATFRRTARRIGFSKEDLKRISPAFTATKVALPDLQT